MRLKYLIIMVLYLIFLAHLGLIFAVYTQGIGWLIAAPLLLLIDMAAIPQAIEDWNS